MSDSEQNDVDDNSESNDYTKKKMVDERDVVKRKVFRNFLDNTESFKSRVEANKIKLLEKDESEFKQKCTFKP